VATVLEPLFGHFQTLLQIRSKVKLKIPLMALYFVVTLILVRRAVVQFVETLRYKPGGRGFDSFGVTGIFP